MFEGLKCVLRSRPTAVSDDLQVDVARKSFTAILLREAATRFFLALLKDFPRADQGGLQVARCGAFPVCCRFLHYSALF